MNRKPRVIVIDRCPCCVNADQQEHPRPHQSRHTGSMSGTPDYLVSFENHDSRLANGPDFTKANISLNLPVKNVCSLDRKHSKAQSDQQSENMAGSNTPGLNSVGQSQPGNDAPRLIVPRVNHKPTSLTRVRVDSQPQRVLRFKKIKTSPNMLAEPKPSQHRGPNKWFQSSLSKQLLAPPKPLVSVKPPKQAEASSQTNTRGLIRKRLAEPINASPGTGNQTTEVSSLDSLNRRGLSTFSLSMIKQRVSRESMSSDCLQGLYLLDRMGLSDADFRIVIRELYKDRFSEKDPGDGNW